MSRAVSVPDLQLQGFPKVPSDPQLAPAYEDTEKDVWQHAPDALAGRRAAGALPGTESAGSAGLRIARGGG